MDKIKLAQELAESLLDECICQVGDDKGALPDVPEDVEDSMDDLEDYVSMGEDDGMLDESEEVKVSDVPKDKQKIFKINRGKAREKGGPLTKAEKGGKPIKESNQVAIAQQKDTLFDKLERVMKNKTDKDTSLNPEPTTEGDGVAAKLATWMRGKVGMQTNKDKEKLAVKGKKANQANVAFYNTNNQTKG